LPLARRKYARATMHTLALTYPQLQPCSSLGETLVVMGTPSVVPSSEDCHEARGGGGNRIAPFSAPSRDLFYFLFKPSVQKGLSVYVSSFT